MFASASKSTKSNRRIHAHHVVVLGPNDTPTRNGLVFLFLMFCTVANLTEGLVAPLPCRHRQAALLDRTTTTTTYPYCPIRTCTKIVSPHTKRSRIHKMSRSQLQQSVSFGTHFPSFPSVSLPLISPSDNWGNWAALTSTASLAQVLGTTTAVGRLLGPPVTAMAMAFGLASVGVLPAGSTPAAKSLQLLSLQLATPLLLLGADLRGCAERCGPLLQAFFLAAVATLLACVVGWCVCKAGLQTALGHDGLKIAAALMAKNIGGGINYVAVCRSLNASSPAIAAGLCVDNLFALVYFPVTSALAANRPDVAPDDPSSWSTTTSSTTDHESALLLEERPTSIQQASTALSLAALLTWAGERIGGNAGALPCSTLLTVLLASILPTRILFPIQPAAHVFGTCGLYLFFATAGAPGLAVADSVRHSLIPLGLFLSILYGIHGLILGTLHKLFPKHPAMLPQRLLVASSAAIGGPATAAALAQAHSWTSLLVPSLLVGNLGYAIATFLGIGYHAYWK